MPAAWKGRLDLVVANAPYVPTEAMSLLPPEARLYESPVALDGGRDGLAVLRRVAAGAVDWLAPGGHLAVEVSRGQVDAYRGVLVGLGLVPSVVRDDDLDAMAVLARRPG